MHLRMLGGVRSPAGQSVDSISEEALDELLLIL